MEKTTKRSEKNAKRNKKYSFLGWVFSCAVAMAVIAFVFGVWLTPLSIYGDSMAPALYDGEIVLVDRLGKYGTEPRRGDVILFADHNGEYVLKRIVGLPGERVEIVGGSVFIDSRPLAENGYQTTPGSDALPTVVPAGSVYVLGDNRTVLYDSRTESVGCIRYEDVLGVLRFRIYPVRGMRFYF